MAIGAGLGRAYATRGMREVRIVSLARVAFAARGLELRVNPFAIRVLRANDDCARGSQHGEAMTLHSAINTKLEYVIPHNLRVIGRVTAVDDAFVFVLLNALIDLQR